MTLSREDTQRIIAQSEAMLAEYRANHPVDRVAHSTLDDGTEVSTIRLPLGKNPLPWEQPFETMVFGYEPCDLWTARYWTREKALAGHMAVLAQVKAGRLTEDFNPGPVTI